MPTNEERREVAARLRSVEADAYSCCETYYDALRDAVGCGYGQDWQYMDFGERLADLIEPQERTCTFTESSGYDDSPMPTCSACGYVAKGYETAASMSDGRIWYPHPYCMNCGAKVVDS